MQSRRYLLPKKPFEGKYSKLSENIIKIFYQVHTELGYSFTEKVYQKVFGIALHENGLKVDKQIPIKVYYHGQVVGEFFGDMLVIEVGYVLNFGK